MCSQLHSYRGVGIVTLMNFIALLIKFGMCSKWKSIFHQTSHSMYRELLWHPCWTTHASKWRGSSWRKQSYLYTLIMYSLICNKPCSCTAVPKPNNFFAISFRPMSCNHWARSLSVLWLSALMVCSCSRRWNSWTAELMLSGETPIFSSGMAYRS